MQFIALEQNMRAFLLISIGIIVVLLFSGCSNTPVKRYFPPQARLQQLQRLPNGQWQAHVRLQNFSTGAVEFHKLTLQVQIQDLDWTSLSSTETQKIGPNNAEIFIVDAPFTTTTQQLLNERLQHMQAIRYVLKGTVQSIEPNKTYPLDYQGHLNPAPGLTGVYR
jgi:hypothetical protein